MPKTNKLLFLVIFILFLLLIGKCGFSQIKLQKKYYTIYYDTGRRAPIYTTYLFTRRHIGGKNDRTNFSSDAALATKYQLISKGYKGLIGYDKGHLAPNDDFKFSSLAQQQNMVFTNAAPQVYSFNRTVWRELENHVRNVCNLNDSVKVLTGIFPDTINTKSQVPTHFWKVLYYKNAAEYYIGENRKYDNIEHYSIMSVSEQHFTQLYILYYRKYKKLPNFR